MKAKRSILVVDDDIAHRTMLRILLGWEYEIFEADCGSKAIEKIQNAPFDLVLMDVCMPEINGVEALDRISEIGHCESHGSRVNVLGFPSKTGKTAEFKNWIYVLLHLEAYNGFRQNKRGTALSKKSRKLRYQRKFILFARYSGISIKGAAALSSGRRLVVLDFKMPDSWPIWLVKTFVALTRPFGVTLDLADRHPWESIDRSLDLLEFTTKYFGIIYIAAGQKS